MVKIGAYLSVGWMMFLAGSGLMAQTPVLTSVQHRVPPYIDHWNYDQYSRPFSILTTNLDSTTALMFYSFIRDKSNVLTATSIRDVGEKEIYSFHYYYNSANRVERIEK